MSLSIGIVGLPNVGKSTLFNALTDNSILVANYPFATIEPNTGIVPVPDPRLNKLAEMYNTSKIIPATVTFVDIAGLVAGASQGEGLGNKFLANIRQCDAIIHIVRAFHDDSVMHVSKEVNPKNDIEIINTELILADIQTIESRLQKVMRDAKGNPKLKDTIDYLNELLSYLKSGKLISELKNLKNEYFADLNLLTSKSLIYVFNIDEETLTNEERKTELKRLVEPSRTIFVCAKLEDELRELNQNEATELLESYGVKETGLVQLIKTAYDMLGLQSFLTAGPKEVRAWTIHKGSTAPQSAGVIHTDFEKGFIAAQIVDYDDLITTGSEVAARSTGKIRTEGRDYIMRPGDIVEFRFNVSK
ncbi:MAG TPA: redox-regulated ATPase YchF [Candidatus Saccharibacteria bacterium]|nr:redox-regulated ATPase YchF [Candidatus Saccharibacteria bacterium]